MQNFTRWIEEKELNELEQLVEGLPIGTVMGRTAIGLGQLGGRLANTAISGLGKGVMSGLKRAGDVLRHGQQANHLSLKYQDVIQEIESLMKKLEGHPSLYNALKAAHEELWAAYYKNQDWRPAPNPIIGRDPRW